jgi:hypothetical protein
MGDCTYCQTKAGLFKTAHESCTQDAESARAALRTLIAHGVRSSVPPSELLPQISVLKERGRLKDHDLRTVLLKAADAATLEIARANPTSIERADAIGEVFKAIDDQWFSDPTKLVNWHGYLSLLHSSNLHEVLHGQVPYYNAEGFSDFRFAHGEHPILRRNALLYEYKSVSRGSQFQSVSVPIGRGMYYRVGTSAPRADQTSLVPVAEGLMVIATQSIYFTSHQSTFRLPYSSILRLESFVDGFGVYENHGRGKVFVPGLLGTMDEGWYFYNLVSALMAW